MLTNLTAQAVYSPKDCKERILEIAEKNNYETRPTAKKLKVSYPTFLRVVKRLGLKQTLRTLWTKRRRENKAKGK